MLRLGAVLRVAPTSASAPQALPPPPLKVVVLTMIPNGGAVAAALRILGYSPYTFEDSLRKGHLLTHPQEWMSVLRHEKPFSFDILKIPHVPEKTHGEKKRQQHPTGASPSPQRYYDALVGPPATIAFEAILKECPRSTRVVLVEEVDKLAWEKDMDQWLRPLAARCEQSTRWWQDSCLHTMLLDMVDLRRALIAPADLRKGRRMRPLPTSSAAMTAQNVPLAQQQATLRLAGALDLFEQHVKELVPSERLLVFRVEDGWQPLCDFLQRPVPTSVSSSSPPSAASDAVTAPREPIPFPVNSNGSDVLSFVDQGVQKANAIVLLIMLSAAALGLLLLGSFRDELRDFYRDYRDYVYRDFEPYLEEERRIWEAGEEPKMTTHKALFIAKKSSQRFGEVYEKEGGAARSMSGVLRRFAGIAAEEPTEHGEKMW
ncbi:putative mitochondrial hypothetical protein [Leptomonas pyrrhocoris]|uniref:Uncharacterized protein n=1 Tax=Leptomonas pyrrhocoris TaxID=157538 RepID=A0A0M9FVA0_LEPPY|nr:putative mitochondrial hypothetical protein [Leptomonas pyrrhocoris]KPA76689.1 putative mitochondrial hypothetical protein [Leptomonas pyrrhocoris]|eukprot:XP_015655128.1 putative mitochondrial hypothetical protein [Leptomonas pyrrhocoris]